jgi:hypothetical protein
VVGLAASGLTVTGVALTAAPARADNNNKSRRHTTDGMEQLELHR